MLSKIASLSSVSKTCFLCSFQPFDEVHAAKATCLSFVGNSKEILAIRVRIRIKFFAIDQ